MASRDFTGNGALAEKTNVGAKLGPFYPVAPDNGALDTAGALSAPLHHTSAAGGVVEVINTAELARRLGVPERWVRSRSNPKRTDDPIPHYKFGRYVQFPWGSEVLRTWLNRQLVSTDRAGHSRGGNG